MKAYITINIEMDIPPEDVEAIKSECKKSNKTLKYHLHELMEYLLVHNAGIEKNLLKEIQINIIDESPN